MSLQRPASLDQAIAMFEALPNAAELELADLMGRMGRDVLAIQRARVAKDTGTLAAGLSSQLLVDEKLVRLRVGLLGVEAMSKSARKRAAREGRSDLRNLGDIYYGRFVEFGRRAQTVTVHRLSRAARVTWRERVRARRARSSVKPADLGSVYTLKVRARAAARFVNPVPDTAVTGLVDQRLQTFLDRVMTRAEHA